MIYSFTVVSTVVSTLLWSILLDTADKKSITHATILGALEFGTIFSVVGVLYSGLQSWINSPQFDASDLDTVHGMEAKIVQIRHSLLPILDLNKRAELAVVTLLVVLAAVSPKLGSFRIVPRTKLTLKWLRRAYVVLTILASFTFFGSEVAPTVGERTAKIKAKIEDVKSGYQLYDQKLERIVRRLVVRTLAKSRDNRELTRRFDDYIDARNRAITRFLSIPHSELITSRSDAGDFDLHYRAEFNEFRSKVKTEEQRASSIVGTIPLSIADGNSQLTNDLNHQADSMLDSTEEETDGVLAVVEEAATLVHEETSKKVIESLVTGLSNISGENELFKLLYEPFLETPIEELVKKFSEKLFESTKYGKANLKETIALTSELSDDKLVSGTAVMPELQSMSFAVSSLAAAAEKMDKFEADADAEINRKARLESDEKITDLSLLWKRRFSFPTSTPLQDAADTDLATLRSRIEDTADPLARVQLAIDFKRALDSSDPNLASPGSENADTVDPFAALLPGIKHMRPLFHTPSENNPLDAKNSDQNQSLGAILGFENDQLKTHAMRGAIQSVIRPLLAIDEAGNWGSIRKAMLDAHINSSDPATIESVKRVLKRISSWRTDKAVEFVLTGTSATVGRNVWEKEFYNFTLADGEVAALWGWIVKGQYEGEVESRYGRAIPEYGYQYYVAETHLGTDLDVKRVFMRPDTNDFITRTCDQLGK